MTNEKLAALLRQTEKPNIEFKSEWYKIDDSNQNISEIAKHEMVRDILALANNVPNENADPSYLIIGASNFLNADNSRELFDVNPAIIKDATILDTVNSRCAPRIPGILCHPIEHEGKTLVVIEVAPSYQLHETTKRLTTKGEAGEKTKTYQEYTVFVRLGEGVRIASQQERESIIAMKQSRYKSSTNISPVRFGPLLGAVLGAFFIPPALNMTVPAKESFSYPISGAIVGGSLGLSIGYATKQILDIAKDWKFYSKGQKWKFIGFVALLLPVLWIITKILS